MKKGMLILMFLLIGILNSNGQNLSGLSVNAYPSSDTGAVSRTMIDLVAKFECSQILNIESVSMKIGNAAGQSQIKITTVPVQLENGNYYTMNGNSVYKITDNKILVRSRNLTYTEVKSKYVTVSVKFKNGTSTEELSIQY